MGIFTALFGAGAEIPLLDVQCRIFGCIGGELRVQLEQIAGLLGGMYKKTPLGSSLDSSN